MTSQTELSDFCISLNWKCANLFAVFNMIAIWAVTYFAGDCFVDTFFMNFPNGFMAFKAGFIGLQLDWNISLVGNVSASIVTIFSHAFRDKKLSTEKCGNSEDHKRDNQFDEVGVVFGFRLLVHVILLKSFHCWCVAVVSAETVLILFQQASLKSFHTVSIIFDQFCKFGSSLVYAVMSVGYKFAMFIALPLGNRGPQGALPYGNMFGPMDCVNRKEDSLDV